MPPLTAFEQTEVYVARLPLGEPDRRLVHDLALDAMENLIVTAKRRGASRAAVDAAILVMGHMSLMVQRTGVTGEE